MFDKAYNLWHLSTTFQRKDKWVHFQELAEKEQRAHLNRVKVDLAAGAEVLRLPGTSVEYVILSDEDPAVGVINLLLRQVEDDQTFNLWDKEFAFPGHHSRKVPKGMFDKAYQLWHLSTTFQREHKWGPFQELAEKEQRAHLNRE
jgi:hypothetical protein